MRVYTQPEECLLHEACRMSFTPPKLNENRHGRPKRPSIPQEEMAAILRYAEGRTLGEVAKKFNRPYTTLHPYLRDICVVAPQVKISEEKVKAMREMRAAGATIMAIQNALKCSQASIRTYTKDIQVPYIPGAGRKVPTFMVKKMKDLKAKGMSNRAIGREIGLTGTTVGKYV